MPEEKLLDETFIVQLLEVKEADGSYTKKVFIGRLDAEGKTAGEPDEAILVQQQNIPGPNEQLIEGIAECFYRVYAKEVDASAPKEDLPPGPPLIIAATDNPTGPLPTGKIVV